MSRFLFLVFALASSVALAQSPAPGAPAPNAAVVGEASVSLIEHLCACQLTSSDKQQVMSEVATGFAANRTAWLQGYSRVQVALTLATYHNAYADADSYEHWRRDFASAPPSDPECVVMDRHDPIVAVLHDGKANVSGVVTQRSLHTLEQAAVWARSSAGLPALGPGFLAEEQQTIQKNYANYPPNLQEAYAHISRNFAAAYAFLAALNPAQAHDFLRAHLAAKPATSVPVGPGASTALLAQDLYNEVLRRGINPVKLSLVHSNDPLMMMYTYNARRDAWHTMNP